MCLIFEMLSLCYMFLLPDSVCELLAPFPRYYFKVYYPFILRGVENINTSIDINSCEDQSVKQAIAKSNTHAVKLYIRRFNWVVYLVYNSFTRGSSFYFLYERFETRISISSTHLSVKKTSGQAQGQVQLTLANHKPRAIRDIRLA